MTDENWYAEDRATMGDRLSAAREARAMTAEAAATRLGVRGRTLRDWENDRAAPRANRVQMLAALYGVSLRWLLTGEGEGPGAPDAAPDAADLRAALADLRRLKGDLAAMQDRLARVERVVARQLQGAAHG